MHDPEYPAIPIDARRGRGAASNVSGRFEVESRQPIDDGWHSLADATPALTEVQIEAARTIITTNQSPDISFDQSINAYRGCEHGCIYCYARPTHCYLGHSAGLDFETRLYAKANARDRLEAELAEPGYRASTIALGTNTDPYQPIERRYEITRQILEVLRKTRHPVGIVTKSALVTRDIDILGEMARQGLAKVALSITTLDRHLARRMEPRAATPERRLEALRQVSAAGIPTAVMVAPIVPSLTDSELEGILEAARDAGASEAGYVLLRLPLEIKDLFGEWLAEHAPDRARRVMAILREMREGKDYDSRWHVRQKGTGPYAQLIARRFQLALKRLGLNQRREHLRTDLFEPPVLPGQQMRLL
ncbi:MAG: PA0069 family radical SAM protein [Hyphomicrobiaceae bacterium]